MSVYLKLNELENRLAAAENTIDAGVSNDGNLTVTGQLTAGVLANDNIIKGNTIFRDDRYSVGSNIYSGINIQNLGDSTSIARVGFIDFINYLGYQDASIFAEHKTDGSAILRFLTTPAGAKNADRRYLNPEVIISGGNIVMANGQGISFAATAEPAGMTSETLTDYEEGTWDPTYYGETTAGSFTYNTTQTKGYYTKIGRVVYIQGVIITATVVTPSAGNMRIAGLPYTVANTAYYYPPFYISVFYAWNSNMINIYLEGEANSTSMKLFKTTAAGTNNNTRITYATDFTAGSGNNLTFAGYYFTA